MSDSSPSILVVDDDVDTCRNLSDILSDLGYRVTTAHNGPAALELVQRQSFDIALLDFKMPGMDGLTLYREIKKISAGTVAIVVTAFASPATLDAAQTAGAWQVLSKPVDFKRLLDLVQHALDQPLVMVVDDDHDLCANLWDLLRERGFRVALAHSLKEAEGRLKDHEYKVVLIDMKLPDGDGSAVFRVVKKTSPPPRTIVISGFRTEMEKRIQQVQDEGADAVCYKPFDIPNLVATLQKLAHQEAPTSR